MTNRNAPSVIAPFALSFIFVPLFRENLTFPALWASIGFSLLGYAATVYFVPRLGPLFSARLLKGKDRLKRDSPEIPESMGLICASVYILFLTLFIPFLFADVLQSKRKAPHTTSMQPLIQGEFPHRQLAVYLAALLSLLSATLLGFLDDVFDIRWRYKLPIPLVASIPLLLVYFAEGGNTHVVLPRFFRHAFGYSIINLGPFYYLYMSMLSTFCTNSINILAGINGVEVSQALVIAASVALNDFLYLPLPFSFAIRSLHVGGIYGAGMAWGSKELVERHLLSLYFMLPLIGVCAGFLHYNWFPARAFPGDTLCYFAGMAFAVVGILGHFSKTLLLFFIPQVCNFLLSCPQLFGLVPCPRHRMPRPDLAHETVTLLPSIVSFEHPLGRVAIIILESLSLIRLIRVTRNSESGFIETSTNLTLLNSILVVRGPMTEQRLSFECVLLQIAGSCLAFGIRYGLSGFFYDGDRR